jgi:hypothetical protein
MRVEISVESVDGVRVAARAGAARVEVCAGLSDGGLTPSAALIEAAAELAEVHGDLADAAQNVGQIAETLRGTPPLDWLTAQPVSPPSGDPEIAPIGHAGFGGVSYRLCK